MAKYFRKPYRIKRKKSIWKNRFFWLSILILVFLLSTFYFLFFSKIFQVEKIIVTGEQKVSKEEIKLVVESELEEKILFLKTKSIWRVSLERVRESILNKFVQIEEVKARRNFPDGISVLVIERTAISIFCRDGTCFLLDNNGVIFENTSKDSQLLRVQNLLFDKELKLGEKVVEKDLLSQITEINEKLKNDLKIPLEEALIVSEQRLNTKTTEGWDIYFNLKGDLNWQITKLKAVLENKIPPEKRRNLEYIDLRFERVYIFPETYNQ